MARRQYLSRVRAAAAETKRGRVIEEAAAFLRREPVSAFGLESVAKAAGVTRLTVYNQFGSRRGLLEAVFDHLAERGRLQRIGEAVVNPEPRVGLQQLVEIFCEFWSGDPAVGRLHEAMALDAEFAVALAARNERRRRDVAALVERLPEAAMDAARRRDSIDLIFSLMSYPMFRLLSQGRAPAETCALIKAATENALTLMTAAA
ncbi:MAG: transcriptional regulatory protein [Gammaproteobacteria bacterium]|nr:transcriptional regulatory protein [Gammaproteobacteria bacterium]